MEQLEIADLLQDYYFPSFSTSRFGFSVQNASISRLFGESERGQMYKFCSAK